MTRRPRGFTLLEVVIALTIVATLLVIMFSGLRVGVAAWQRGDERALALERTRSLTQVITRALGAAYPYTASATKREEARLLFEGERGRVAFATAAPPFPGAGPAAFTAVTLAHTTIPAPGVAVTQKVLPNENPFDEDLKPLLLDASVTDLSFRYLSESSGEWTERWDGAREKALPRAVEVTLTVLQAGRAVQQPPLVVALPVTRP
jgi:general secretion pathway protein J